MVLIVQTMSRLRGFLASVLLMCWLPATSHCLLASLDWASHDCCDAAGKHSEPVQSPEDCAQCTSLEGGSVEMAAPTVIVAPASWIFLPIAVVNPVPLHPQPSGTHDVSPPGLLRRWHFLTRVALPARTPAIVV